MKQFELKTISNRKYLIITLVGLPCAVTSGILLGVFLNNSAMVGFSIIIFGILTIYLAHRIAITNSHVVLNDNSIILNDRLISFNNIIGYFLNDAGLTMTAITLKLDTNEVISLTTINFGSQKKPFVNFTLELTHLLKVNNANIKELSYQEVYVNQVKYIRRTMYLLIPIVILLNLFTIYLFIATDFNFAWWKLILVNSSILTLIPYIRKKQ